MAVDRRRFFQLTGLSALGIAGGRAASTLAQDHPGAPQGTPLVGKRWAMLVDVSKCLEEKGCDKCVAACHLEHNVPDIGNPKDEVKWIWKEGFGEALPEQRHAYMSEQLEHGKVLVFCNHCDNPPCTRVCPTQATWKREADGVVMMDWHRCIGCRYCVAACPYGSRSFNWRDPRPFLVGQRQNPNFPTRTRGVVEKCNFCEERLAKGLAPSCVEACPEGALVFGDLEDADSEARKILQERPALRRKAGLGTQPQVYYLV